MTTKTKRKNCRFCARNRISAIEVPKCNDILISKGTIVRYIRKVKMRYLVRIYYCKTLYVDALIAERTFDLYFIHVEKAKTNYDLMEEFTNNIVCKKI